MLHVYEHAAVNVAATRSADSDGGLFAERRPSATGSGLIRIDSAETGLQGRFRLVHVHDFERQADRARLNSRAWVLQERVLSRRIIHYAQDQVYWDCAGLTASESIPAPGGTGQFLVAYDFRLGPRRRAAFLTQAQSEAQALGQWARIVNAYSKCGLTFLDDKPTAIAGVVDLFQRRFGLEPCAGMWRQGLEIQLGWLVDHDDSPYDPARGGARNDLAPSWSWISVNGSVNMQRPDLYEGYDVRLLARVTEVDVQERVPSRLAPEDGHGQAPSAGHLRMRCCLNPVAAERAADGRVRLRGPGMEEHFKRVDLDSLDELGRDGILYFVPLFDVQYDAFGAGSRTSEVRGVLVRATGEGTFVRCGHVFVAGHTVDADGNFPDSFRRLCSPQALDAPDAPAIAPDETLIFDIDLVKAQ